MTDGDLVEVERRVENWAMVVTSRGGAVGHCGSAEGHYRRTLDPEELGRKRTARMVIDDRDGWVVEQAWRRVAMAWRTLLAAHYVWKMTRPRAIRWVGKRSGSWIKPWQFEAARCQALRALKRELDNQVAGTHNRLRQFEYLLNLESAKAPMGPLALEKQVQSQPAQA